MPANGVDPHTASHAQVDADTNVYQDSIKQLVNCMQHDNFIMGVCGETRIANKRQSWVTAIQVCSLFRSDLRP